MLVPKAYIIVLSGKLSFIKGSHQFLSGSTQTVYIFREHQELHQYLFGNIRQRHCIRCIILKPVMPMIGADQLEPKRFTPRQESSTVLVEDSATVSVSTSAQLRFHLSKHFLVKRNNFCCVSDMELTCKFEHIIRTR